MKYGYGFIVYGFTRVFFKRCRRIKHPEKKRNKRLLLPVAQVAFCIVVVLLGNVVVVEVVVVEIVARCMNRHRHCTASSVGGYLKERGAESRIDMLTCIKTT